jgi:aryl-alcohol dehydrogenase-like predicted oxidoreductase
VLCGARNASQAIENADAGSLELTEVELAEIDGAAARHLVGVHV